jgi:glycerol-3-phosphate dehydrogenase
MTGRRENLQRLRAETFDVLIVGGGINGAGIARDLALRGVKTALVERRHFASGTSGKNSQLIHGGLRYLKNLEFGLVREALRERSTLIAIAPHLVHPLPFLIPMYRRFDRLLYGAGLALYDGLAGAHSIGRRRGLSSGEVRRLEPDLESRGLAAGAVFFDAAIHSARFVLQNVFDSVRLGAAAVNYARYEDGWVTDTLSGERFPVRAKKLVDATGPWSAAGPLRLVRGSHIVLPKLNKSENAIAYFEESGRIIFVIPWGARGELSLVGTTDYDHEEGPDSVHISAEEVRYLQGIVKRLFPAACVEPISAYSSLRPLLRDESASPTKTSREHRIWNSADGVLHVSGGKYTTYRAMSEQAADLVCAEIAPTRAEVHLTASTPLGRDGHELMMGSDQDARLAHAVEHEMAQRLTDFLYISTYLGYERRWTAESLEPYAAKMGRLLGWDARRTEEEIESASKASALPARG